MADDTTFDPTAEGAGDFSFEETPDALPTIPPDEWDKIDAADGDDDDPTLFQRRRPVRKRLTPQRAKAWSKKKESGFLFLLQHTRDEDGHPMEALVRRLNFLDADVMKQLPKAIQRKLFEMTSERTRQRGENRKQDITMSVMMRELQRSREMANTYVMAGFIDPRVYETQEEAELMDGVWVEDIDIADRMIFVGVCEGGWDDAQNLLRPFLEESDGDVEAGASVQPVSGEAPESDDPFGEDAPFPTLVQVG
jgi:hypothetical protein